MLDLDFEKAEYNGETSINSFIIISHVELAIHAFALRLELWTMRIPNNSVYRMIIEKQSQFDI